MIWILVAVMAWVVLTIASIGFGRAAAKPWPEQTERFREDDDR